MNAPCVRCGNPDKHIRHKRCSPCTLTDLRRMVDEAKAS